MFIYAKIQRILYKTGFRMYKGAPLFGGRTIPQKYFSEWKNLKGIKTVKV